MQSRSTYLLGFVSVSILLLGSAYLQFVEGIIPCPLCTLQRLSFVMLGLLFFSGILIHGKRAGRLLIDVLAILFSLVGLFLAGRQIWLQHFPPANSSECGVSLQYMMQVLPMNELMQKIFSGSAECTQQGWKFLYLNMAEWAFLWFAIFLFITLYLLIKELRRSN